MKKFKNSIAALIFFASFSLTYGQTNTVGLVYSNSNATKGYTLFTPENNTQVYLIDHCGQVVNEWTFSEKPALTCYLLENGNLLRAGKDSLEIRDWDNNVIWAFDFSILGFNQHHDIEPLPNGNVLCVVKDIYTNEDIIEAGRDTAMLGANFRLEKVIELQPEGLSGAQIVWEWKLFDHLIQDFDPDKSNYGIISEHSELIDLNFDNEQNSDYIHFNAIDYHADLDHILLTARHLSELYIIDHSTTTEEAAGHSGGNSNRGGDLLWRWGNPQVYQQGSVEHQALDQPHDAKWVEKGYADEGQLSVFNNGGDGSGTFSSIHLLAPLFDQGNYQQQEGRYLPVDFSWSWSGTILGEVLFESKKSGTHALSNGNMMICQTSRGQITEITKTGELLWAYINPHGFGFTDQYETIQDAENTIFRGEKYSANHPGFEGKDMLPLGIIENENALSDTCSTTVDVNEVYLEKMSIINPVKNGMIQFTQPIESEEITIFDIQGKPIHQQSGFKGSHLQIMASPGIYILSVHYKGKHYSQKLFVE